jgi:anti-sigma regulatory factor (Ser/Thr protein kinase)
VARDEVILTVPGEREFYSVAHLVLGGLAVRNNLTLEDLEDLQIALTGLLDRARSDATREVTMRMRVIEGGLEAELGPFDGAGLRSELEREPGEELSLSRILAAVVDKVSVESRADGAWVVLRKAAPE